jgi:hypothetical protein
VDVVDASDDLDVATDVATAKALFETTFDRPVRSQRHARIRRRSDSCAPSA